MRKIYSAFLLMFFSVNYSISQPARSDGSTVKDKYHAVEVDSFETQSGVELPPDYFAGLQDELVKQLQESDQFEAVLRSGQEPPKADMPVLRLTGVVTGFKEGSRAKRYFVGFGAGTSQIFANAKYIDRATGATVIEQEVIGTLSGGLFGGDSKSVMHDFAKTLVTTTKLTLMKKLPVLNQESTQPALLAVPTILAERTTLGISAGDLQAQQEKLNELAALGYRIITYASTGNKTATLTLEKGADQAQSRAYLMFKTALPGTMQKELNKAAAEGYRLVPHTLGFLGGYFLIAEKAATVSNARFEYRVRLTMRVSSAQKNIKEDQAAGYVLIDASELPSDIHLFVLEKSIDEQKPAS
jgi:hypothetical protein